MAVVSRVNANFPLPGIDQSSKGFRDNFSIIKQEIEALQAKTIQLVGDVSSEPTLIDGGAGSVLVVTQGRVMRQSFVSSDVSGGILTVNHNLGNRIVMVQISNNVGEITQPDVITLVNNNRVTVDLSSFVPFTGTWNVIVRG